MKCRKGCGACCIAVSISSPLPGMPGGKPAGVRCANLLPHNTCSIHGTPAYPEVCRALVPSREMCGASFDEAMRYLEELERATQPEA
ncbi:MAG: YkgJ family cysteine cluster protein [Spirochaetes bacterium]|nr:YkgJ family cysteine cluster protein [Spirochaetota bacterium]